MSTEIAGVVEIWALVFVNFLGFFLGATVTAISYYAYLMSEGKRSLRNAPIGFGLLTFGMAVEPAYQLGIVGTHILAPEQNVWLQVVQGAAFSLGFLVLFLALYRYRSHESRHTIRMSEVNDGVFEDINGNDQQ